MATGVDTWTARLVKHASEGTVLDLTPSSGSLSLPEEGATWIRSRRVPAQAIVAALTQTHTPLHRFGLRVSGAQITGDLDLRLTTLAVGLELRGCAVPHDIAIADATVPWMRLVDCALSGIQAERVRMRGNLMVQACRIDSSDGTAFTLDGAHVEGGVFLGDGLRARGKIRALGATIDGPFSLRGTVVESPDGAVVLDGATVGRGAFLDGGFQATGEVRALGATINGQLSLRGARLSTPSADALSIDRARIDGDLFLDEGFEASGAVRAPGATITGILSLRGAKIRNLNGDALNLDRIQIGGSAFMDEEFEATGEVHALAASITGDLSLRKAKLDNPEGDALNLDGATLSRTVFLDRGFEAHGAVSALGTTVVGQLVLRNAILDNPEGIAFNLEGATVHGGLTIEADIRGSVSLRESLLEERTIVQVGDSAGLDVSAAGANLTWLDVRLGDESRSTIDLAYSTIGRVDIHPLSSLSLTGAVGWSLGALHGELLTRHRDVVRLLHELPRGGSGGFVPQPWKELANAIERAGEPAQARRLRWQAARRTTRASPLLSRAFIRIPYGLVVGYGYYPLLTMAWILAVWAGAVAIAFLFRDSFIPTDAALAHALSAATSPDDARALLVGYPAFNPALYALDISIPAANTGESAAWRLEGNGGIASLFAVAKAFSWGLTALLVAGITGILRKD